MPGTDHAGIATQAVVEKRLLRRGEEDPARPGPDGAGRTDLGLEGRIRKADPEPASLDGLLVRLGANALHARRALLARFGALSSTCSRPARFFAASG